jgi:hypothetical protein
MADSSKVQEARSHGRTAYEYLTTIYEYFEDDIDDMTGKKSPPKEVLLLSQEGTEAASKELKTFLSYVQPPDLSSAVSSQVKQEFNY